MKKIYYGHQHITEEDIQSVVDVLRSDYLTQGCKVPEFEEAFANYIGAKYAVAVSNGTAALHLCALAIGINKGHKVITTPITFIASANCIRYANGEVVFADIDPETYLLDIERVRKLLESSPKGTYKGIIPVDFAGRAVHLDRFRQLADEYGLWILEDACHAPGGYFTDKNGQNQNCGNGNYADLAIFSFHPVKHITTGEGGMITTNNEKLYHKLRQLRTHGIQQVRELNQFNNGPWYYEMQELGFNYRLTDIQAALGISQIKRLKPKLKRRKEIATVYAKAFSGKKYIKRQVGIVAGNAYHLFIAEFNNRDGLYHHLHKHNISVQVHYIPVHLMPYYRQFGWKEGDFPMAENYYRNCLSLPIYPTLDEAQQSYVIQIIKEFYNG
jgi:hypothetical protein